jgi:hypothetical protein
MAEPLSFLTGPSPSAPSPRRGLRRQVRSPDGPRSRRNGWGEGVRQSGLSRPVPRHQQILADRLDDAIGVGQHVVVPEAKNAITVPLDDRGWRGIACGIVLPAVQLDSQSGGTTCEVGDVGIDLKLTDEFLPLKPAGAEVGPEAFFGFGLACAQVSRDPGQALSSDLSTPSPNPLPPGERAYSGGLVKLLCPAVLAS